MLPTRAAIDLYGIGGTARIEAETCAGTSGCDCDRFDQTTFGELDMKFQQVVHSVVGRM
jgi:hypothetical protein